MEALAIAAAGGAVLAALVLVASFVLRDEHGRPTWWAARGQAASYLVLLAVAAAAFGVGGPALNQAGAARAWADGYREGWVAGCATLAAVDAPACRERHEPAPAPADAWRLSDPAADGQVRGFLAAATSVPAAPASWVPAPWPAGPVVPR